MQISHEFLQEMYRMLYMQQQYIAELEAQQKTLLDKLGQNNANVRNGVPDGPQSGAILPPQLRPVPASSDV